MGITRSDKEIWEKIKNNDKKSFEILFNRYHDSLCLYAYGLVRNDEAAEEIVNDVFFKIWCKRDQIQINYGVKQYLFRSVFNASTDFIRRNLFLSRYSFVEVDSWINETIGTNEEYIFDLLENEDVQKDVMKAIEQLPPQCKAIFCLSRFDLLTYNEISEKLNISVNTIKTQMSRALDSLRKQLGKYLEAPSKINLH
jgi:RNA polymerase sigma-70 factor (ECF subfamily)